ncbi:VOC family protein [Cylindrospermopsis raciborskii]|nr:VOC family protein [Cylindrospermopsis raciborskii]EFA73395.1 Glyoxalase/bleomycin resistance protein/dioxygenase [Raphidiopsis brookii D9]MCZ2202080.1 VOC family protein [Cylindrospermopsis raciborskii PAMP2012]MCZ2207617.1 VOC family protein [Cylindrospermopsis raciborskii PAMP2011]
MYNWRLELIKTFESTGKNMWLKAIDHIQITSTPELEADMRFFYGQVLGLPEIPKPASLQGVSGWYQLGNTQVHIGTEPEIPNIPSRRHIAFEVENLGTFREHLETLNVDIIPDRQPLTNCDRFFLRDPAGNRVEILAYH